MHGGLPADVEMRVRCAVQRTEPLSCGCLGLRQLREKKEEILTKQVKHSQKRQHFQAIFTHCLTADFERARAPLLAARLEVVFAGRLVLAGDLALV